MPRDAFLVDEMVLLRALLLPQRTDEQVLTFLMSSPWHEAVIADVVADRFDRMVERGVLTVSRDVPWPPAVLRPARAHVTNWLERFALLFDNVVDTSALHENELLSHPSLRILDGLAQHVGALAIVSSHADAATGAMTRLVTPSGLFDLLDE